VQRKDKMYYKTYCQKFLPLPELIEVKQKNNPNAGLNKQKVQNPLHCKFKHCSGKQKI